ncbi:MAG: hypothetical protein WB919_07150, partial [Candidatus Sulfotelmatobacter sp.]
MPPLDKTLWRHHQADVKKFAICTGVARNPRFVPNVPKGALDLLARGDFACSPLRRRQFALI